MKTKTIIIFNATLNNFEILLLKARKEYYFD